MVGIYNFHFLSFRGPNLGDSPKSHSRPLSSLKSFLLFETFQKVYAPNVWHITSPTHLFSLFCRMLSGNILGLLLIVWQSTITQNWLVGALVAVS